MSEAVDFGEDAARVPFAQVFTEALRGVPAWVVGLHHFDHPLPMDGWAAEADESDRDLLSHCQGATIDIGCGPGRMCAFLAAQGRHVLGIDIVPEAVRSTRGRGAPALQRSVFDALPGEGRWETALLADGNVGIGGNPAGLLRRVRELLAPGGRVVVDLEAPGTGLVLRTAHLEVDGLRSHAFPWAMVGPEAVPALAEESGLSLGEVHHRGERHFAVLHR